MLYFDRDYRTDLSCYTGIYFSNLYSDQIRKIGTIENSNNIIKVIYTNNFLYLISKNKITIYR